MARDPYSAAGPFRCPLIDHRIRTVMEDGGRTPYPFTAILLERFAAGYERAVRWRAERFANGRWRSRSLPCRVVSVGNLTAGGTGKTPMARYLAALLRGDGYRVAVVSRGYRGSMERHGAVVSDGRRVFLDALAAGDEPYMLAVRLPGVPVIVGSDRYRGGRIAVERFGAQVVVLDDGFQHLPLRRDLDIVLLDERRPFGNGFLLPRGSLREPKPALKRADAIVLTRAARTGVDYGFDVKGEICQVPVFRCSQRFEGMWIGAFGDGARDAAIARHTAFGEMSLEGRRVFVFSGIADNRAFRQTVETLGGELTGAIGFDDHHRYLNADCRKIARHAKRRHAEALVTTYKDYVKIAGYRQWPLPLAVVDVRVSFGNAAGLFTAFVRSSLASSA